MGLSEWERIGGHLGVHKLSGGGELVLLEVLRMKHISDSISDSGQSKDIQNFDKNKDEHVFITTEFQNFCKHRQRPTYHVLL